MGGVAYEVGRERWGGEGAKLRRYRSEEEGEESECMAGKSGVRRGTYIDDVDDLVDLLPCALLRPQHFHDPCRQRVLA